MNCENSEIYLAALLDDELTVMETLEVQKHLAECERCRQRQDQQLALRAALRNPDLYANPRAGFATRIGAAVQRAATREARPERSRWFVSLRWAPAAAVLLIIVAGAFYVTSSLRESREGEIADAVLAGHIRSLQAGHLLDVPSSDQHTVKPWFQGKLDFSPPVPDLTASGWILDGGRLDYLNGRPVAALVYQRRKHYVNVFLWPAPSSHEDAVQSDDVQGYHILHWTHASMTYWLVSDLNPAELVELAGALRTR